VSEWFAGLWERVKTAFWAGLQWLWNFWKMTNPILLIAANWEPITEWFQGLWGRIGDVFENAIAWVTEAGKRLWEGFVNGLKTTAGRPIEAVKSVLSKIRQYLPFSDAKVGPLAELTASGRALGETFAGGMLSAVGTVTSAAGNVAAAATPQEMERSLILQAMQAKMTRSGTGAGANGGIGSGAAVIEIALADVLVADQAERWIETPRGERVVLRVVGSSLRNALYAGR